MDSGEEAICEEYESSLEDLTFNSKPLINVLTMLAEENSQYASSITKLIAKRTRQVQQQYKLPSLYLLDSIVKNVGGDYLHLVAQIMEETFTCVFEKGDEKTRRDLYKLRHTWSQYFPAKMLYDLDVAVNKFDPGWPIPPVPPPSPSIHINPKFLKKAESGGGVAALTAEISTPQEHQVVEDHQQRLVELERLQQEQLKLTELEIQEHQMKRDLLLKKQQQERQLLLQQQQQNILNLRLTANNEDPLLSNGPRTSVTVLPVSTKAESTEIVQTFNSRDPRLRRSEQERDRIVESKPAVFAETISRKPLIVKEMMHTENDASVPLPTDNSLQFEQTPGKPPDHFSYHSQQDSGLVQNQEFRNLQHMAFVENPVENVGMIQPVAHLEREVTGSPKYGDIHRETKPKHNQRRRNSGDWPSHSEGQEHISAEDFVPKAQGGRGNSRKARRRSAERQRERGKGGRGRGRERNKGPDTEHLQNSEFQTEKRFARRAEQRDPRFKADRPVDSSPFREDWGSDVEQRSENFVPRDEHPLRQGKWKKGHKVHVYVRGRDHDEIVRSRSPGIADQRLLGMGPERDRIENREQFEPEFSRVELHQDPEFVMREEKHGHFLPRERNHPAFHNDPRDQSIGEPVPKKPRPLLSDVEINELRNRKGASPKTGRLTPPPMLQEGFHPFDRGDHPFPPHIDDHFHPGFGPPPPGVPPVEHHEEWEPSFEIPRELMLDHESEIMRRADRRLQSGDLTADQHHDLVDKLHQLYELQRHPEQMRHPLDMPSPQRPENHHRHVLPPRQGAPMDMDGPPIDVGPGRPMPPVFEEHSRIPFRGPTPRDPQGLAVRHDGPRFEPQMRMPNEDFRGHPMERDERPLARPTPVGPGVPPNRFEDAPRQDGGPNPVFVHGRPMEDVPAPRTPPRQDRGEEVAPHTPNTMMEKRAVDDLFRRLMHVGIIKATPEPGGESPRHAPSPAPPPAEAHQPQPPPARPVTEVLPALAAVMTKKVVPAEKISIPKIKLVPEELKRRYDGVISNLYEGTQCSSCGLRFPGEAAKIYREHLDWHFRKNRREKDSRRVAHRQWYFIVKDWLNYEEISDPDERARSSFFDVTAGAVDSPDPLSELKEGSSEDGSCPVLAGDSEAEAACDICCEKFEQFWEETNEEWHYKAAVRVDGKTYHLLCYQDAKENQGQTEEDENDQEKEDEESVDTDADETSPGKDEAKIQIKQDGDIKGESKTTETKEASEIDTLGEKTDKSDAKPSEKGSCKIEGAGAGEKGGISLSSNSVDNKENETKGDDK